MQPVLLTAPSDEGDTLMTVTNMFFKLFPRFEVVEVK